VEIINLAESDLPILPALQPPGWREIRAVFEYYFKKPFCTPVKVLHAGRLVGVGAAIRMGDTGWVGHIIVRSDHRRKGVGSKIVDHLIAFLRGTGCSTISLVATDEGLSVYENAGFVAQAKYVFFERAERPDSEGTKSGISRYVVSDLAQILRIDGEVSGEDRRRLYEGELDDVLVYRDGESISGFFCPGLGEGFVAALNSKAGNALLAFHMMTTSRVALPVKNPDGIQLLERSGFQEVRRSTRMVLGPPFPWRPEAIYSRIGGNLG